MQIPWPLWEVLEEAAPELGYQNAVQLLMWSGYYSVAVGKPHYVTAPIANAPTEVQDAFIADLVAARKDGRPLRGSMFEAIIADIVQRFNLPVGEDVVKALVADTVRNRPRRVKGPAESGK